jgi:hypothetical protein
MVSDLPSDPVFLNYAIESIHKLLVRIVLSKSDSGIQHAASDRQFQTFGCRRHWFVSLKNGEREREVVFAHLVDEPPARVFLIELVEDAEHAFDPVAGCGLRTVVVDWIRSGLVDFAEVRRGLFDLAQPTFEGGKEFVWRFL